ncbi:F0F1 ATP synthase subunit delta [Candidatus Daviesbacteria bacterium]|nr:F0F1 ATP synthase subunit delta [Candidatus Daviesbacteria bacterium]
MKKNKQLLKLVQDLVDLSFKDSRIVENQTVKAIKLLKKLPQSKAIFAMSEFLKELKRREREHTMYIETAIPLSSVQVNKMKKIVEKRSGEQNRTISKVLVNINPDILGGFKLRIGDEIWDETILGKIEQVKEAIRG